MQQRQLLFPAVEHRFKQPWLGGTWWVIPAFHKVYGDLRCSLASRLRTHNPLPIPSESRQQRSAECTSQVITTKQRKVQPPCVMILRTRPHTINGHLRCWACNLVVQVREAVPAIRQSCMRRESSQLWFPIPPYSSEVGHSNMASSTHMSSTPLPPVQQPCSATGGWFVQAGLISSHLSVVGGTWFGEGEVGNACFRPPKAEAPDRHTWVIPVSSL